MLISNLNGLKNKFLFILTGFVGFVVMKFNQVVKDFGNNLNDFGMSCLQFSNQPTCQ